MAEIQNMSLAHENTLKNVHFMPLDHFPNIRRLRVTRGFMRFWRPFLNAKTRGEDSWIWHFRARHFDSDVETHILVYREFGSAKNEFTIYQNVQDSRFFLFFLVDFSGFLRISYFPNTNCLVLRSLIMKSIVPNNIEEMSGNSIGLGTPRKTPGKHLGKMHLSIVLN